MCIIKLLLQLKFWCHTSTILEITFSVLELIWIVQNLELQASPIVLEYLKKIIETLYEIDIKLRYVVAYLEQVCQYAVAYS